MNTLYNNIINFRNTDYWSWADYPNNGHSSTPAGINNHQRDTTDHRGAKEKVGPTIVVCTNEGYNLKC